MFLCREGVARSFVHFGYHSTHELGMCSPIQKRGSPQV